MATHDYVLANAAGAAFRSDLNNALAAIVSQNSSATEPTITYAYMPWFDTTNGILKFRNATNTGWVIDDLNSARGSVTMHATTMDLWAEPKIIDGTGSSVTITDIADAPQAGAVRILYPVAGTTITNNSTFSVDGGKNYTSVTGDAFIFEALTTSTFKVHIIGTLVGSMRGTNTNDNAATGDVGEYVESNINSFGGSLSDGVVVNLTSITLTAGDWDVSGVVYVAFTSSGNSITQLNGAISTTSATLPSLGQQASIVGVALNPGTSTVSVVCPETRISISSTTTVYLIVRAFFATGTLQSAGKISARRRR